MTPLVAYTDGSGTIATKVCGAGVVVYDGDPVASELAPVAEASRHLGLGTNNHAELSAVRVALYVTAQPPFVGRPLVIRTDSEYVITMCRWRGALDPERKNSALVNIIRRALHGRQVRFEHVAGHSGIPGNERADVLAGLGRVRGMEIVPRAERAKRPRKGAVAA